MIRPAQPSDVDEIHAMIGDLAAFEKLEHQFTCTVDDLRDELFGDRSHAEAWVAENDGEESADRLAGYAIVFHNFSTFLARSGLYLEDLYVRPSHRKRGIGKSFLIELAKVARSRGCGRFEWSVLDWNQNAIDFYESVGAQVLPDWRIVRMDVESISQLADSVTN